MLLLSDPFLILAVDVALGSAAVAVAVFVSLVAVAPKQNSAMTPVEVTVDGLDSSKVENAPVAVGSETAAAGDSAPSVVLDVDL